MKFTVKELARLLAAMRNDSIGDDDDNALIARLAYRLEILKAEEKFGR